MLKLTGIKDDTIINDNNEIFIFLVGKINEIGELVGEIECQEKSSTTQ